jgi:uncharacterized protein YggU (UPF0235/DUF167 family)
VRVQPRAREDALLGERAGALLVRVTRPPEAGEANAAVLGLLAASLRHPRSKIRILRGDASRDKLLLFEALSVAALKERLAGL